MRPVRAESPRTPVASPYVGSREDVLGSGDLLRALGWPQGMRGLLRFSGMIGGLMLAFVVTTVGIASGVGISPVVLQVILWGCWLFWLGYLLPRHQARDRRSAVENPYKKAFWRELCFGIAFNFAMVLRPVTVGLVEGGGITGSFWLLLGGACLISLGAYAIFDGTRQLGISCAFFVYEYSGSPPVVKDGIYGLLRHPLFVGGICISVGMALCVGTSPALELALVNALVLIVYRAVEDNRCSRAVGPRYIEYRQAVGGILPRRR